MQEIVKKKLIRTEKGGRKVEKPTSVIRSGDYTVAVNEDGKPVFFEKGDNTLVAFKSLLDIFGGEQDPKNTLRLEDDGFIDVRLIDAVYLSDKGNLLITKANKQLLLMLQKSDFTKLEELKAHLMDVLLKYEQAGELDSIDWAAFK